MGTEDTLTLVKREFNLDAFDSEDLKRQVIDEEIPPHVCVYTLEKMRSIHRRGEEIRSPKALFVSLMRQYRNIPESVSIPQAAPEPEKVNPLAGDGFDFWCGGRTESERICQAIFWNSEADAPEDQQAGLDLLAECAPVLREGELMKVLEIAHDYDGEYGIIGTYPLRLARAVRYVVEHRAGYVQHLEDHRTEFTLIPDGGGGADCR